MSILLLAHGFSCYVLWSLLGLLPTIPSQFEVGSSFAMVPNPVGKAAAFFAHFDQPEINDFDPVDF